MRLVVLTLAAAATACADAPTAKQEFATFAEVQQPTTANTVCGAVQVSPVVADINVGDSQRLYAYVWSCEEFRWMNRQATWSVDNSNVATVVAGGNWLEGFYGTATGLDSGVTLVHATIGSETGGTLLRVHLVPSSPTPMIVGAYQIRPQTTCRWTAETNIPDPIFDWQVDGTTVGTTQDLYYSHPQTNTEFALSLNVTSNSSMATAYDGRLVMVAYAYGDCPQ